MLDYRIEAFVVTARHKSFAKAAEAMNISKTAIIKQVEGLEHSWKVTLFTRDKFGIELTEDGKYMYQEILKLINISNGVLEGIPSKIDNKKLISIANCHMTYADDLKMLTEKFCSKRGDVKFKCNPYFNSDSLYLNMNEILSKYDLAFFFKENIVPVSSISYIPICYTPLVCAVNSISDLNKHSEIGVEELKGHDVGFLYTELNPDLTVVNKMLKENNRINIKNIDMTDLLNTDYEVMIIPEPFKAVVVYPTIIPMTSEFKISSGLYFKYGEKKIVDEFVSFAKCACE